MQHLLYIFRNPESATETQFWGVDFRKETQIFYVIWLPDKHDSQSGTVLSVVPVWSHFFLAQHEYVLYSFIQIS